VYESKSESERRYLEIIRFLFQLRSEIIRRQIDWKKCKDDDWNSTLPKIVDNAIFLLMTPKIKPTSGSVAR